MFNSFFKSLGFIADEKNTVNDTDLIQGREFLNYEQRVTEQTLSRLSLLELTSMPGLTSINEAFTSMDSVNRANTYSDNNTTEHENAFNQTLSEYSALQQNLTSSGLKHNVDVASNNKIMSKLVELNDKLIYHAEKIGEDMDKLDVDDASLKQLIQKKQTKLNEYIQTLYADRAKLTPTSQFPFVGKNYNYLVGFILLIIVMVLFIYILTSNLVKRILFTIISIMVIYILARIIFNK